MTRFVALFKHLAIEDESASTIAGTSDFQRHGDLSRLRFPGIHERQGLSRRTVFSRWVDDPVTGEQVKQTYAERFKHQYQQFKRMRPADQDRHAARPRAVPVRGQARRAAGAEHLHRRGAGRHRRRTS